MLPGRVAIGTRQELHRRQQMAEMLAVVAASAAEDRALLGRRFELGFSEHGGDSRAILFLEAARIGRDAAIDPGLKRFVHLEQLGHEAPAPIEPLSHAPRALFRAVAETDRPLGGEFSMISDFLDRLVRE